MINFVHSILLYLGVDELQEIPFQPDSEILPARSKYGDGESESNQSIACGESEKHSKCESKSSFKREYRKDLDGHVEEATSCEKQTRQKKRKYDVVYTQSVYSGGDGIEKMLDNDSHISSSRKVKMKRQRLEEVSDSSKNTEHDVLSSLPSSLAADKDTNSDISGSLEQFEVDCLKRKSDANKNISDSEHDVEGSWCVDSGDDDKDTCSVSLSSSPGSTHHEAIKDSESLSFLNNCSSTSVSQSLDLDTELTPSSMSFLDDFSSTNTTQTLDFDNEFTLQSQRERYDAFEKKLKADIKLDDDRSLSKTSQKQ